MLNTLSVTPLNTLSVTPLKIQKQINRPKGSEWNSTELVVLTKTGGGFVGYHGKVISGNPGESWIRVCPDSLALDPIHPDCAPVTLELTVPPDASDGHYDLTVQFTAEDDASDTNPIKIVIDVQQQHPLKNWLQQNIWLVIALGVLAIVVVAIVAAKWGPAIWVVVNR